MYGIDIMDSWLYGEVIRLPMSNSWIFIRNFVMQ